MELAEDTTARQETLREAEHRLQRAQLTSDVSALDDLLHERLLFTVPVETALLTKTDDLTLHASGRQVMTRVEEQSLRLEVIDRTGVTWFDGEVAGTFDGQPFEACVRYTRTWVHDDSHGWRLVAVHASGI